MCYGFDQPKFSTGIISSIPFVINTGLKNAAIKCGSLKLLFVWFIVDSCIYLSIHIGMSHKIAITQKLYLQQSDCLFNFFIAFCILLFAVVAEMIRENQCLQSTVYTLYKVEAVKFFSSFVKILMCVCVFFFITFKKMTFQGM